MAPAQRTLRMKDVLNVLNMDNLKSDILNLILEYGASKELPLRVLKMLVTDIAFLLAIQDHTLELQQAKILNYREIESGKHRH